MIRWSITHARLRHMTPRKRQRLFDEFRRLHPRWKPATLEALQSIVVDLDRQVDICEQWGVKKQALNRSTRFFRYFFWSIKVQGHI